MTAHCDDLDTFFDGELAADRATDFRDHLASCPRCQEALRGRMLEAAVVADVKPSSGTAIDELAPRRSRRRWGAVSAGLAAVAAAAAVVWFLKRPGGDLAETGIVVERGDRVVRGGDVTVGDTIHATARGYRAIWIYRDDRELVLACPGGPSCRTIDSGIAADLKIPSVGNYAIVMLAGDKLPAPQGSLDEDVSIALDSGATHRIEQIQVR